MHSPRMSSCAMNPMLDWRPPPKLKEIRSIEIVIFVTRAYSGLFGLRNFYSSGLKKVRGPKSLEARVANKTFCFAL